MSGSAVVAVDLEGDSLSRGCRGQLGSFPGAEHNGAVVDDEVDREDVWTTLDDHRTISQHACAASAVTPGGIDGVMSRRSRH